MFVRSPRQLRNFSSAYSRLFLSRSYCSKHAPDCVDTNEKNKSNSSQIITGCLIGTVVGFSLGYFIANKNKDKHSRPTSEKAVSESEKIGVKEKIKEDSSKILENNFFDEDSKKLKKLFQFTGSFVVIEGPEQFNQPDLVEKYLETSDYRKIYRISGQELLNNHTIFPSFIISSIMDEETICKSTNNFIWINEIDLIKQRIESIPDEATKKIEIKKFDEFINWLEFICFKKKSANILIQSIEGKFLRNTQFYDSRIQSISLGEPNKKISTTKLKNLLEINGVCIKDENVDQLIDNLGGSNSMLQTIVKSVLAGENFDRILLTQKQNHIAGLENILLHSKESVIIWDIMQLLVNNYERTGSLFIPHDDLIYSSNIGYECLEGSIKSLLSYIYFYQHPTDYMIESDFIQEAYSKNKIYSGFISASSIHSMKILQLLVNNNDLKRIMWERKKTEKLTLKKQ